MAIAPAQRKRPREDDRGGSTPEAHTEPEQHAGRPAELRARFKRAVTEGDQPQDADTDTLARYVQTVNFGLTVQATTGATRKELLRVVDVVLNEWPK